MKKLIIWIAKKYAVSAVKDAVSARGDEVSLWAFRVRVWIERLGCVCGFLVKVSKRLEDGALSDDEAADTIADAKALADEVTLPPIKC